MDAAAATGSVVLLGTRDEGEWLRLLERMPARDVAHLPSFSRVYEDKGDGVGCCFVYQSSLGTVLYPHIRRPIGRLALDTPYADHCDAVTPYCYGGFIHNAEDEVAPALLQAFRRAFEAYCRDSGVVSEFVRFHPLLQNQRHCEPFFDRLPLHQDNVVVDLTDEVPLLARCRPTFRRYIRLADKAGLDLRLDRKHTTVSAFAALYGETMRRHDQTGYLDLPADFFQHLFRHVGEHLLLFGVWRDSNLLAAAIFIKHAGTLDYFLGGSATAALPSHPNHLLFYRVACWAREQGFARLHLGGGRPSLHYFKRGFSHLTVPYHIGQKIHDPTAYAHLTEARHAMPPPLPPEPSRFFPAYREGLE